MRFAALVRREIGRSAYWVLACAATCAAFFLPVTRANAQVNYTINGVMYAYEKVAGKVVRVRPGWVDLTPDGNSMVSVAASQDALDEVFRPVEAQMKSKMRLQLNVTANADFSYLSPKQFVSFTADLDSRHVVQGDIKEITVFTPTESTKLGLSETGAPQDDRKIRADNVTGTYVVAGQITSVRDSTLAIKVPNEQGKQITVTAKISRDVPVKVTLSDLSLVQPGDSVELTGYQYPPQARKPGAHPILGESIQITLARSLSNPKKLAHADKSEKPEKPEKTTPSSSAHAQAEPGAMGPGTTPKDVTKEIEPKAADPKPATPKEPASPFTNDTPALKSLDDTPNRAGPGGKPSKLIIRDAFSVDGSAPKS